MGLKYNPATGKLLRTATPKLVDECGAAVGCANTQVRLVIAGIAADPFGCPQTACNIHNTTRILPPSQTVVNLLSGCATSPWGNVIIDGIFAGDPDTYLCTYKLEYLVCSTNGVPEIYSLDFEIYGKIGYGWVGVFGWKSPGRYNTEAGMVATFCEIMMAEVPGPGGGAASGELLDFAYFYQAPPDSCGVCGVFAGCDFQTYTVQASVELAA